MSESKKFQEVHTLKGEVIMVPFFERKNSGGMAAGALFDTDKNDLIEMYILLDDVKDSELAKDLRRILFCHLADRLERASKTEPEEKVDV